MSEIHGATGSYVVNALDPDELEEFEAHLAVCPTCRNEIVEFCETAAELSLLAAAPPPPPGLRSSILSSIAEVRPLPPLEGSASQSVPSAEDLTEHVDEPEAEASRPTPMATADPVVDELALRRSYRRTRVLTMLVAAATVVALALGGVVVSLVRSQQAPLTSAPQVDPSLIGAPDATIYTTKLKNGAHASFVVSKSQDRAVFVSNDLPAPGPGKRYQLWTLQGAVVQPDNLLDGGTGRVQPFSGPIAQSTQLAVTIEPESGSTTPTPPIQAIQAI